MFTSCDSPGGDVPSEKGGIPSAIVLLLLLLLLLLEDLHFVSWMQSLFAFLIVHYICLDYLRP